MRKWKRSRWLSDEDNQRLARGELSPELGDYMVFVARYCFVARWIVIPLLILSSLLTIYKTYLLFK